MTMSVLHVSQPTVAGTAVVVRELVRGAHLRGLAVAVASPAGGDLPDWCEDIGVKWIELPMKREPGIADLTAAWRLRALMADYDVVHLHSSKAGALGRLAAATMRRRPRIVFTPHAWSWHVGGRMARVYQWLERRATLVTDCIVAVSFAEADDGRVVLGADAPLTVIPNGVDLRHYSAEGPIAPRGPGLLVVVVGRLSPQKGQDRAIEVVSRLPQIRLRLVGDGPERGTLSALAEALNVRERVEFVGSTDPRPHVRAADIVLQPSRWEGMSIALLEAMAMARPVVATACGGTELLLGAGVVVPQDGDVVTALVDAVQRLSAAPDERMALGEAARIRVARDYSWARAVERHLSIWGTAGHRR